MNILFLTLVGTADINERGIYNDLMRKFRNEGHNVYIVSPSERRLKQQTCLIESDGIKLLKIKTLNIQKTNILEKGISTLLIEYQFLNGIKKYFKSVKFDLVLYSTPPITYTKIIKYIKNRDSAKSYLLLKDIFPQNAVDIGLIKKNSIVHKFFRKKEKQLYKVSDFIGCMSPANKAYLLKHNREIDSKFIEVNPNSIEPVSVNVDVNEVGLIRSKYGIPADATIFMYGGNLGLPQGIDFLMEVLDHFKFNKDIFFIIIGSGTMFPRLKNWFNSNKPENSILLESLPKEQFDNFVLASDVGLIFLDKRFTIPNFPSRLLSYMEFKKPIVLATDSNADIGKIAEENNFGLWSVSGDLKEISSNIKHLSSNRERQIAMGQNGYEYFINNFTTSHSYSIIMKHFESV